MLSNNRRYLIILLFVAALIGAFLATLKSQEPSSVSGRFVKVLDVYPKKVHENVIQDPIVQPTSHTSSIVNEHELKTVEDIDALYKEEEIKFLHYYNLSQQTGELRRKHGVLKIAGFTRIWPPPIHAAGGMQYHAMHLYSRLASLGHIVHVFTTGSRHRTHYYSVNPNTLKVEKSDKSNSQLTIYQCPSKKDAEYSVLWYHSTLEKYNEIAKEIGGFSVAHSESWAAVANSAQLKVPLAVTWHGSMLDWFRNEMNSIIQDWRITSKVPDKHTVGRMKSLGESVASETFALQSVPHHVVISESARDDLMGANLIPRERVHLVYNGVNEENYKPNKDVRETFLAKHKIPSGTFVVGCGGRLSPEKGHKQLSHAMDQLLKEYDDISLAVVGTGPEGNKYKELQKKGLKVFMLGSLPQDELARFYNSIDVFVDPFWQHHGMNTVMIEAALTATPVIATDLPPSRTTVQNAAFGRTFQLGIPSSLASAILFFKNNPKLKDQIGAHSRTRAIKLFTSEIMANKYEEVFYKSVLEPLHDIPSVTGEVICVETYPAMCYRLPEGATRA